MRHPKIPVVLLSQDGFLGPSPVHGAEKGVCGALVKVIAWVPLQPLRIEHKQGFAYLKLIGLIASLKRFVSFQTLWASYQPLLA